LPPLACMRDAIDHRGTPEGDAVEKTQGADDDVERRPRSASRYPVDLIAALQGTGCGPSCPRSCGNANAAGSFRPLRDLLGSGFGTLVERDWGFGYRVPKKLRLYDAGRRPHPS
jgi:hypothetical protein